MSNYTKTAAWVGLIVSLVIGLHVYTSGGPMFSVLSGSIASPSRAQSGTIVPTGLWGGIQVGPQSQVPLDKVMNFGTCNLTPATSSNTTFAATSTMAFNCNVQSNFSLQANDFVQMGINNPHNMITGGFIVEDAYASSTATGFGGTIVVDLYNLSGAATSSYSAATTSAYFEINRI